MTVDTSFFSKLFNELRPTLKLSSRGTSASMSGKAITPAGILTSCSTELQREAAISYIDLRDNVYIAHFAQYAFDRLKDEEILEREAKRDPSNLSESLEPYRIGEHILTGERFIIKNGGIQPDCFEAWFRPIPEEDKEILEATKVKIIPEYNPYKPLSWKSELRSTNEVRQVDYYNTYIPPDWIKKTPPLDEDGYMAKMVGTFFHSFFLDVVERHYAVYWMNKITYSKCLDALIFCGCQGNGKGTFFKLLSIMVGEENATTVSKKFGSKEFNWELKTNIALFLDEYKLSGDSKESIKLWMNDLVSFEGKGDNPEKIKAHCNFVIANNNHRNIHIEYKDRRFSPLQVANTDLRNAKHKDGSKFNVDEFLELITTDTFKIWFPYHIQKINKEYKLPHIFEKHSNFKGPKFYELVETSKPNWFKKFKKLCEIHPVLTEAQLRKIVVGRNQVGAEVIEEQLRIETEERIDRDIAPFEICEAEVGEEGSVIYVSNIFKPTKGSTEVKGEL